MGARLEPAANTTHADSDRLPGSDKTTVSSHVLGHRELRDTLVVLNEFGAIAIDAGLEAPARSDGA